jgi:hypothetical protein
MLFINDTTSLNEAETKDYIESIVDVYSTKGRFYDPISFRVVQLDFVTIVRQPCMISERDTRGELDPRTRRNL